MPKYFIPKYNIITLYEYLKNIESYQFSEIIEVENKNYIEVIKEDFKKEFLNYLAINHMPVDSENKSILESFDNSYDYMIIDDENLENFFKYYNVFTWGILDLAYYFDMPEEQKFNFVYSVLRYVNLNLIIKVKRESRNLEIYPIEVEELKDQLMLTEEYNYDDLF